MLRIMLLFLVLLLLPARSVFACESAETHWIGERFETIELALATAAALT